MGGEGLCINAAMFWFGLGVFIGAQLCLPLLRKLLPKLFEDDKRTQLLDEDPDSPFCHHNSLRGKLSQEASQTSFGAVCLSAVAGAIWTVGLFTNLRCGKTDGFALAFGLSQTAPLPAAFWGLIIFHEFSGSWVPMSSK